MDIEHKYKRAVVSALIGKVLRYVNKNPQKNLLKLLFFAKKLAGDMFPESGFEIFRSILEDESNAWNQFLVRTLREIDPGTLRRMSLAFGLSAGYYGTKAVRTNRDKYNCNIPWVILMDPTSSCNLKCKGCWASEYDRKQNLTYEEMADVIRQGKQLGVYFYMFTGGEPLIRKDDVLRLCEENPDCVFLAFTNGTLVDEAFCKELRRVGNMTLALSIEGERDSNDARRGSGIYERTLAAMDLLKKEGCLFGMSVCYTRENVESVTSDDFIRLMSEKGVRYGWYFNFMPVGKNAVPELIPTPAQREHMYNWVRKMRSLETDNALFVLDFQDDGEYVGGCIAGGRNYFHINSAGDIEPCVFIHYSDANIRTDTLLDALQKPLFQAYRRNQPFNDNHLRPCPLLENPDILRKMVKDTGAKSTDLLAPEDVDDLCAKCDAFAKAWAPEAQRIWDAHPHTTPMTQYYRDTPEGKAEIARLQALEREKALKQGRETHTADK